MKSPLDQLKIASPCNASWAEMSGDERVRFCQLCSKNVYNLSNMSRTDAENLVKEKEGNLCVRFFVRSDGTLLTQDCPVGLAKIRRKVAGIAATIAAGIVTVVTYLNLRPQGQPPIQDPMAIPVNEVQGGMEPVLMGEVAPPPQVTMGKVAMPENDVPQTSPQTLPQQDPPKR